MEENHWKTFSILFGATGFVLTVWSIPSFWDLTKTAFTPHIKAIDLISNPSKYKNKYITLTGEISDQQSFPVTIT